MIQRIQTVLLSIVFVLSLITLFSPVAILYSSTSDLVYTLTYKGVYLNQPDGNIFQESVWTLTTLLVLVPVISFITILFYKKRFLQIRLSVINLILSAGFYGLLFLNLWTVSKGLEAEWFLQLTSAFPLVNVILLFLAIRAIGKDEALIKSLNRIR